MRTSAFRVDGSELMVVGGDGGIRQINPALVGKGRRRLVEMKCGHVSPNAHDMTVN